MSTTVPTTVLSTGRFRLGSLAVSAPPTQQQIVDYVNAANVVSAYVYAITNTNMAPLNNAPNWYASYTDAFAVAKSHAMLWTNSIVPEMMTVPQTIVNYNALFAAQMSVIQGDLELLISDPSNQQALASLTSTLTQLRGNVSAQNAMLLELQANLTTFANNLAPDAQTLEQIATQALQTAGADQQTINALTQQIAQLQSEIQSQQTLLTVSEIGMAVSVFVGCVGIGLALAGMPWAGGALIVVGVVGLGASIAGTVILTKQIQAEQQVIKNDTQQIDSLNQDITYLNSMNLQFEQLVQQNQAAQQAVTTVQQMWANLEADLQVLIDDLNTGAADTSSGDYADALAQMQAAASAWNEVDQFAQAVVGISYTYDPNVQQIPTT